MGVVVAAKIVGGSRVVILPNRPATKAAGDPMAAHGPQRATVARMLWLWLLCCWLVVLS